MGTKVSLRIVNVIDTQMSPERKLHLDNWQMGKYGCKHNVALAWAWIPAQMLEHLAKKPEGRQLSSTKCENQA